MKKLKHYLSMAAVTLLACFCLTACGDSKNDSTSGNNNNNAVDDLANDAGNAVDDVANGVGNAVDDLVGNGGFNNYADAHDYFLDTMGSYHSDAKFEVRDEDKNLNDYQEGSKGYRFSLYDTSKNKEGDLFGEFYVDANSGMIYKKGENGNITEYPGEGNNTNANSGTGSTTSNQTSSNNNKNNSHSNNKTNKTTTGKNISSK